MLHPIEYSGCSAADKRAQVAKVLREEWHDAAIISDPASIAWLLNIRGNDVPFTPFALGFGLIHADGSAELFMDPAKVSETARAWVGNSVSVSGREAMAPALAGLSGKRIRVDAGGTPVWFADTLRTAGASVVSGSDPCLLLKARKNSVEQAGARSAHERDAIALCEFLRFLDQRGASGSETELSAAAKLLALRERAPTFRGESFPVISAAAEHGAIIHYRVSEESNRALGKNEVYLIDSGAQYLDGTTDVTRTIWTGPDAPPQHLKEQATRVLQGHIRIASLVFPYGICGSHLDAIARSSLWQAGLDYDHGTGHGVGSYLSVHEGPVSLSRTGRPVPIESGMILSNEPGYYLSGAYGIRLENLLLVQPVEMSTSKPFLQFETLTLAPFDHRLIEPAMLERSERDWLNNYHQRVLEQVGPHLDADTQQWLADACKTID
jgi:Xaa-Pro aminopeptidase